MSMSDYLQRVHTLTNDQLHAGASHLTALANRTTAELIVHLAEIAGRKAYLPEHTSLWNYCVYRLKLSEGSANGRVQVANACRRFPQILESLAANRMSLTVAAKLAPHLKSVENPAELIAHCEGKTTREVEQYLVRVKPQPEVSSGIRMASSGNATDPSDPSPPSPSNELSAPVPRPSTPSVQPAKPEIYNFRFAASGEFKRKLERLAEVMGIVDVPRQVAKLLEAALDHALEAKDPQKKLERRKKREAAKARKVENSEREPRAHEVSVNPDSRSVPSAILEKVFERAEYRCEFVGNDGKRCRERTGLQIDHIVPHAMFGPGVLGNLRCLCGAHNRWAAEQVYGREFMRAKIQAARARLAT